MDLIAQKSQFVRGGKFIARHGSNLNLTLSKAMRSYNSKIQMLMKDGNFMQWKVCTSLVECLLKEDNQKVHLTILYVVGGQQK